MEGRREDEKAIISDTYNTDRREKGECERIR